MALLRPLLRQHQAPGPWASGLPAQAPLDPACPVPTPCPPPIPSEPSTGIRSRWCSAQSRRNPAASLQGPWALPLGAEVQVRLCGLYPAAACGPASPASARCSCSVGRHELLTFCEKCKHEMPIKHCNPSVPPLKTSLPSANHDKQRLACFAVRLAGCTESAANCPLKVGRVRNISRTAAAPILRVASSSLAP